MQLVQNQKVAVALYARAWIEITVMSDYTKRRKVALYARAWVEICGLSTRSAASTVALHAEGVDRNRLLSGERDAAGVALHAEGVDRNLCGCAGGGDHLVALLSPSMRRAWIEIVHMDDRQPAVSCRPPCGGRG